MTKVLVTGAAGFVGHHVVDYLLKRTDWQITIIDRLDVSGNLNRLAEIGAAKNPRVKFVYHDLKAPINFQLGRQIGAHDFILHLAASTHVDRSISQPLEFVFDNVVGTCNILDFARGTGCQKFLYFSTDEVFGPAPKGTQYLEDDRYRSGNPYAATKAGGEELAIAYENTYKLPVVVTHTMNVIGRRQHPEKYVPMTIQKVYRGEKITIHADATKSIPGSRFYIDAEDVADGVMFVLENGKVGEKFNIVGEQEIDNLQLAEMIAAAVGKNLDYELVDFHSQRPGHDLRYALDGNKLANMGWTPRPIFGRINDLVSWTLNNPQWLLAA
jgi:dTDP-glucose 4,6-dehydratase